jgi:hypothetical protein
VREEIKEEANNFWWEEEEAMDFWQEANNFWEAQQEEEDSLVSQHEEEVGLDSGQTTIVQGGGRNLSTQTVKASKEENWKTNFIVLQCLCTTYFDLYLNQSISL